MTHTVGTQNRSEFIADPAEALRRSAALDALWPNLLPPRPRGVTRATHAEFNRIDDARALEQARLVNRPNTTAPQAKTP